jgi:hypothetical protein
MLYAAGQEKLNALDELRFSLIGYVPEISPIVPDANLEPVQTIVRPEAESETVRYVLEHTAKHYEGYSFRCCRGNRIYFKRVNPPMCDICNRQHDSDNALFMTLQSDHVTKSCLRDAERRRVRILDLPQGMQTPVLEAATPAPPKKKPVDRLRELIAKPVESQKLNTNVFGDDFVLDEYSEDKMQPYTKHASAATLIVQAQKGVGKTEELVIKECYVGKTIIALSHRRTFAAELCRQLPGFVNYESLGGRINPLVHNRIVVQVESMCKIDLSELIYEQYPVDLLIMDESESIIEQLGSGLHKNFAASWDVFNFLTVGSEHVIALDANLTDRTLNVLADRRKPCRLTTMCSCPKHLPAGARLRVQTDC